MHHHHFYSILRQHGPRGRSGIEGRPGAAHAKQGTSAGHTADRSALKLSTAPASLVGEFALLPFLAFFCRPRAAYAIDQVDCRYRQRIRVRAPAAVSSSKSEWDDVFLC
jgi:hypothetical protein